LVLLSIRRLGQIPDVSLSSEAENQVLFFDGTNWTNAPSRPSVITLFVSANQTHTPSDTDLEDITDLVFTLQASTHYYVWFCLQYTTPAAADMDITFEAIAGTDYANFGRGGGNVDVVNFGTEALVTASGNKQQQVGQAWLQTGVGGGTLQMQFAQAISNAGDTIINEGSAMIIYQLD